MKKQKKVSTYGAGVLTQNLNGYIKDSARSIKETKLCGVLYDIFFTPLSEVFKKDEKALSFFRIQHLRFLGEILFERPERYPGFICSKIQYQKRKYGVRAHHIEMYASLKKEFQGLWVEDIFGPQTPCQVGKILDVDVCVNNHLQIRDKAYRNLFYIQKDKKRELLAFTYRKYHLHIFWHHALGCES